MTRLLLFLTLFLPAASLPAQVLINEISAANMNGPVDGDGDHEDWVELYNPGSTAVNLSGWFLSDNPNKPQKWTIPNGQTIAAGAYRMYYCSGKNKVAAGYTHTNFKITQTKGESIVLSRPDGSLADSYTFTTPNQVNHSYGRSPNGSPTWRIFSIPTPQAANTGASFQFYAPAVAASLEAGFYPGNIQVTLSTASGYTIRYTTTGLEPTATSTLYSGPVNIAATTVLKARAFSSNNQVLPGFVTVNTYFINVSHSIPVVSISGNGLTTLLNGSTTAPFGAFEYFENNTFQEEGYGEFNKHGNDSWLYPQRGIDWITRDQMGYQDLLKYKFFKERSRTKFQRLVLKAAANDNYPSAPEGGGHIRDAFVHTLALQGGLDVDARTNQSCVMYVNGQYWGVYELREKVDDSDFTSYYYNQDEADIDYIKTWGNTWAEYGSFADWYILRDFILLNDMTIPSNYALVQQQFDLLSLVDYVIINQHSVCKDWLNWNTSWWRGRNPNGDAQRWRYALWDMDATFGHYINYTFIPEIGPTADPCDVEEIPDNGDPQHHIDVFTALYENPEFKALYVNRYADLLNTALSCPSMNALLDSMTNLIEPEMARHCARWGGSVQDWKLQVQEIHDFINARCQILDPAIVDCYDVTGPFNLTVDISPAGSPNNVKVNTITPSGYPFTGEYFGGVNINLVAQPGSGWVFSHWEVNGNTFGPDQFTAAIALAFQTNGTATAFFVPPGPCNEPTGLVMTDTLTAPHLQWTGQPFATSYRIQYRKLGDPVWIESATGQTNWQFDTLPGCAQYEWQIQTVCPQGNSPFVGGDFSTKDYLAGFALTDALICNNEIATLDATVSGAEYQWDDGSSAPTREAGNGGLYWVTVQHGDCLATDTAQVLKINATAALQPVLCAGETFQLGAETFDEQHPAGQVTLAGMGSSGCDSIVNVSLQFLAPVKNLLSRSSCNAAEVGVDTVVVSSAAGCDSLVITTTTLLPTSKTFLNAASCNLQMVGIDTLVLVNAVGCDSLVITNTTFDPAAIVVTKLQTQHCDPAMVGVDTLVLSSVAGCDSLVITTTLLAPGSKTFLNVSSCNVDLLGIDTLVLSNYLGCDSLVITTTTFDPAGIAQTKLFAQHCDPAMVGTDTLILKNVGGCDSLVITTTTLAPKSETHLNVTSCNPVLAGLDTLVLINYLGCDSLVITQTSFDPASIPITKLLAKNCDPAMVGTDTLFLKNGTGCDSLVITTTTLLPKSQILLNATSCNPALAGLDTLVLINYLGCDSLVITQTSFDPASIPVTKLLSKNCDPAMVGTDTLILKNVGGCDSLVITTTTLAPMSKTFLNATSCNPAFAGLDTLVLINYLGCDSLVITQTSYDPASIPITKLLAQHCDPAMVGTDTLFLKSGVGCDSLVITTTTLAPASQTLLSAASCDLALVGTDTLLLNNHLGCDSLVITQTSYNGLALDLSASQPICFGATDGTILLDTVWTDFLPVTLEFDQSPARLYTGSPLQWEPLAPGIYNLLATNAEGCSVSRSVTVEERDALQLDLGQTVIALHAADSVWVAPTVDFDIAAATWSPAQGVQCPDCLATYIKAIKSTDYVLTVEDPNGCTTSAGLHLDVEQGLRVYVPNAIHVGSSGPNGSLAIYAGPEIARVRMLRLFDRWGDLVFEQRDLAPNVPCAWDGTFRGKLLEPGVLVWVCELVTANGEVVWRNGDLTVLR